MKSHFGTLAAATFALTSCFTLWSATTRADDFQEKHPRRYEVNQRLDNQVRRIDNGKTNGQLDQAQKHELRGEERGIKAQERAEVQANGGHITKGEQRQLNQELNEDSRQIYSEKHPQASAPQPAIEEQRAPASSEGAGLVEEVEHSD